MGGRSGFPGQSENFRGFQRVPPRDRYTTLRLSNGREFAARLIDISMSGAAMIVDYQPPIGSPVVVGSTASQVVRLFDNGIAVEFLRMIPPDQFSHDVTI